MEDSPKTITCTRKLTIKITEAESSSAEDIDEEVGPVTNLMEVSSEQDTNAEENDNIDQTNKEAEQETDKEGNKEVQQENDEENNDVEVHQENDEENNDVEVQQENDEEKNEEEEDEFGDEETTETLFQCQLCNYAGHSKEDIADHFISAHATIQVIQSPVKRRGSRPTGKSTHLRMKPEPVTTPIATSSQRQKGKSPAKVVTDDDDDNDKSPMRARSQRKRRVPKWLEDQEHDGSVMKRLKEIEQGNPVSSPSSKRKGSLRSEEEEDDAEVEEEETEEEEEYGELEDGELEDGEIREIKNKDDNSQNDLVDLSIMKREDCVRTQEEEWKKVMESISISPDDFENKVDKAYEEWETTWNQTHTFETTVCPKADCAITLPVSEAEIHASCHMQDYLGFECIYCDERFGVWKKMRKHFANRHPDASGLKIDWECDICGKKFRMMAALKKHVRAIHLSSDVARSLIASYTLSKLSEDGKFEKGKPGLLKRSLKSLSKVGKKKAMPAEEGKEKEEKKKKPRETRTSIKWMPTCGRCAAVYESTEELDNHIGKHTIDDDGEIECTECHEYFKEKDLKAHMKKLHKRIINPFRCVLCEFSSTRRHDIKKHMFCHERLKRFQCDSCGKLLSTPYNLKIHTLRIHATDKQKKILCSLCGFKCAERAVLKDHMRHRHDLTMSGHSRHDPSKVQLPTFPCKICDYVGKKESSLRYHMRVHDGDRPFHCNLCSYASKTKNNLLLHVRTHNGMGTHKCPTCDFTGATSLIIKEHIMAKHTKEKPLKCPHCDWATCYNGNLWKHMQMHRMNDGIPVLGKPKRATRTGITYEGTPSNTDKLLPITSDGLVEPGEVVEVPITLEGIGDGSTTTIMMVPGTVHTDGDQDAVNTVMTFEAQEQVNPGQEGSVLFLGSSNQLQQAMKMALEEQNKQDHAGIEQQQQRQQQQGEVMISVADNDASMQQSISSIITSMAASAANVQQTTSMSASADGTTLIETQLTASEVASHFEDGTIIEITQIPTSGDGTALIPAGAVVERIAPGMSASDIIMKAANMVASGQLANFSSDSQQYAVPLSIHRTEMTEKGDSIAVDTSGNTLPFLAHVATTQESLPDVATTQESLPEVDSATIGISDEMETSVETSEAVVDSNVEQGNVEQGIVEQLVATMLPDGSNVMQIIQTQAPEPDADVSNVMQIIQTQAPEPDADDSNVMQIIQTQAPEPDADDSNVMQITQTQAPEPDADGSNVLQIIQTQAPEPDADDSNVMQITQTQAPEPNADGSNVMQIIQTQAPEQDDRIVYKLKQET